MTYDRDDWTPRSRSLTWLLLVAGVVVPRLLVVFFAVSPARDAMRYWSAADYCLAQPGPAALSLMDCQPLYPMSLALFKWVGLAQTPEAWWRASQIWSVAAYLGFILSAYALGRRLWGRSVAFWGVLAVSFLPRQLRYSSDVLSDNLFSFLVLLGLVFWFMAARESRLNGLGAFGAGVVWSLAFLTRVEAIVCVGSVVLATLIHLALRPRIGVLPVFVRLVAMLLPLALTVTALTSVRGPLTVSNTARAVVGASTAVERAIPPGAAEVAEEKTPVDAWYPAEGAWGQLAVSTLRAVWESLQETRVWIGVAGMAGLVIWLRGRPNARDSLPIVCLLLGTFLLLVVCRWKAGFLAGRYLMPVVPLLGILTLFALRHFWGSMQPGVLVAGALTLLTGAASWFEPLHGDRLGHRQAAEWLKTNTSAAEAVFDPSWISGYFAGRPLMIPSAGDTPLPRVAVIDLRLLERPPLELAPAIRWAAHGQTLAEFPRSADSPTPGVRVVLCPRDLAFGATQETERE